MAATAQDASAPLRGPEKKDEDRDEDGAHPPWRSLKACSRIIVLRQQQKHHDFPTTFQPSLGRVPPSVLSPAHHKIMRSMSSGIEPAH